MGISTLFSFTTFVSNVSSIQGVAQAVNGYHFLQSTAYIATKIFPLSRIGDIGAWKFPHVAWFNGFSFVHRILLIFFNVHRPKSWDGYAKLVPTMGIELFFISRALPLSISTYNIMGDFLVGVPFFLYGIYDLITEKTSAKAVRDRSIGLEVEIEHCRDLQTIQQNLKNLDEIEHFCEEQKAKNKFLESPEAMKEEQSELKWLKTLYKAMGSQSSNKIYQEEANINDKLGKSKKNKTEEDRQTRRKVAVGIAKEWIKPGSSGDKTAMLQDEISKKESALKTLKKNLKTAEIGGVDTDEREEGDTETIKSGVNRARAELRFLKFLADPDSLDEELHQLSEFLDENSVRLSLKRDKLTALTQVLDDSFLGNQRDKMSEHLISLRREQKLSFEALEQRENIAKYLLDKEIEVRFNFSFDIGLLEKIAAKLISCDRLIQCLKGLHEKDGIFSEEFEKWYATVTAGNKFIFFKGEGKKMDKKIEKRDLYAAIITELDSMDELLKGLGESVVKNHEDLKNDFSAFKDKMEEYSGSVHGVFQHEQEDDAFAPATLKDVQPLLGSLRTAFQKKHRLLLKKLKDEQAKREKQEGQSSQWARYAIPMAYISFGLALLAVRFFKSQKSIVPLSLVDLFLDGVFKGCLVGHSIIPLFSHSQERFQRKVIILRDRDNQPLGELLKERVSKMGSTIWERLTSWM